MHLGAKVLCILTTISIGVRYFDKLDFPLARVILHFRYASLETPGKSRGNYLFNYLLNQSCGQASQSSPLTF